MNFLTLKDFNPTGKRVLVRIDVNVPVQNGIVTDATRLRHILPTLDALTERGAKVILLAHFDRPKGKRVESMSLRPIAKALEEIAGRSVSFSEECIGETAVSAVNALKNGDILLLENTRFHAEEEVNDPLFSKALAALGDVYVNDAFSVSHRAHASTEGITHYLPSYAGLGMEKELSMLGAALGTPQKPVVAVVGGAKISSKLDLLSNLIEKVQILVIGGGMANTFLAAQGVDVGISLCEKDLLLNTARQIMAKAEQLGTRVILPVDVVVAKKFAAHTPSRTAALDDIQPDEMILDAGEKTVSLLKEIFSEAKTLVWNGPLGAFELEPFDYATVQAAQEAGKQTQKGSLLSVAGGGDTVSALNHAGVADQFTYISTAGGAFLEWLEGRTLPAVYALEKQTLKVA
jgi:phosphoglycerate kinase